MSADLSDTMGLKLRTMGLPKRFARALFLAGLTLSAAAAFATVTPARRQRAIAAFEKAQQMRDALEAQPESKRHKEDFKKVIDAFYVVYLQNPAYSKTPVALTAIAELYREMGRQFSSDSYFLESIKSYRFLIKEYPYNRFAREAQFTLGEVYRQDLEDPGEARRAFQDFIAAYPKSEKAGEARDILKQLDRQAAERAMAHPAPAPVEKAAEKPPSGLRQAEMVPEERSSGLRQVTAVRRWVGPNYLRIVIEVGGEAKFDSVRLSNPDRIVVDVQSARLSSELVGKTFPVENGFLRQIRVAQFTADVARVVLDVEKIEAYSIFSLPNPFRLVIDVQGAAPTQMARTVKPPPAANAEGRNPDKVRSAATPNTLPTAQLGAAVKAAPPAPTHAKTETRPSTPPEDKDKESASIGPPPASEPDKRSKEKTEATRADAYPTIQPAAPTASGSRTLTRALGLKIGRIVIDPGHGGHDTGTIGPTGLEEKEVVLDVGLKLKKLLEQNTGCEVVMTRSDDTFIPLEERTAIANEKSADVFVSIHANASRDMSARGIETYYLNFTTSPDALEVAARENATSQEAVHQLQDLIKKIAMTEKIEESQDFARQVQREVYTRVTKVSGAQRDRGTKKAPFVVLIGANMPSVLAEISFLTNPHDERLLKRSDYREKIAYALYEGILGYVKNLGEVRTVQRVASDQTSAAARPDF
ncbi:MAG TPA: N-acetylmuramoyl-L-alanine amidase [Terriglobia bacterium]|nr:N-acetylmuramoyl-L-alanine amidase [Terriglobia bacterium]